MKYFNLTDSSEFLKKQYRALSKQNHPDVGGSVEVMQEINAEYALLTKKRFNKTAHEFDPDVFSKEMVVSAAKFAKANPAIFGIAVGLAGVVVMGAMYAMRGHKNNKQYAQKDQGLRRNR